MKLFKVSLLSFLVLCSILVSPSVFGEENKITSAPPASSKSIIISTLDVINPKIISQNGNILDLSFDITNKEGAQADLKYDVFLIKEIGSNKIKADSFVYPEIIDISQNSSLKKIINYKAPSNLDGAYIVNVEVKNNSGLTLGMANFGKIKLVATEKDTISNLKILPESCYLSIQGTKDRTIYSINQGIDISSSENLNFICNVVNLAKTDVTVTPSYETHLNNIDGVVVATNDGSLSPISFKSGEKKFVILSLPKATTPQSYAVKVSLKSSDASYISIVANYVIQGESATIINFSIDKDSYIKGDTANVSIFWKSSADNFINSRANLSKKTFPDINLFASILDNNGNKCIDDINKVLHENKNAGIFTIPATVLIDCRDPQAFVEIKDTKGNILAQNHIAFGLQPASNSPLNEKNTIIFIILGILVVAGIYMYFINLKKKKDDAQHDLSNSNDSTIQ